MHLTSRQTKGVALAFRVVLTLFIVCAALLMLNYIWHYYELDPRTRDGHVRADVVDVTTDVSGLLTEVGVTGNQFVHRGQILFRVDPQRFLIAVEKARASLESAQASLIYARQQAQRNRSLRGLLADQTLDQSDNQLRTATANLDQAKAGLASAQLDLDRATVRAPFDGFATNVTIHPGRFVTAGTGMLALLDQASLRVEGYFQETRLRHVHIGDRARITLMGETEPVYGHVESIAGAITDSDSSTGTNLLPTTSPNFAWVRLAQRIPVWIRLDHIPPEQLMLSGRTATVEILGPQAGHVDSASGANGVATDRQSRSAPTLPASGSTEVLPSVSAAASSSVVGANR